MACVSAKQSCHQEKETKKTMILFFLLTSLFSSLQPSEKHITAMLAWAGIKMFKFIILNCNCLFELLAVQLPLVLHSFAVSDVFDRRALLSETGAGFYRDHRELGYLLLAYIVQIKKLKVFVLKRKNWTGVLNHVTSVSPLHLARELNWCKGHMTWGHMTSISLPKWAW